MNYCRGLTKQHSKLGMSQKFNGHISIGINALSKGEHDAIGIRKDSFYRNLKQITALKNLGR